MDSLYIVMPAYNEGLNIEDVVKAWYPILLDKSDESSLVVADSGSTDETHSILVRLQKTHPQLIILSDTEKEHGPKVIALYKFAIQKGIDYVFQTDSDGQTNPEEFAAFWKLRTQYDGIIGSRAIREDGKIRLFVEHIVCILLKIFFNVNVPDANAPFRLMKVKTLEKYLSKMPENYNIPNIMITTYLAYYNEKIIFKEISFKPRRGGVNSINILKIIKIGWKALGDFTNFKKEMKYEN